MIVQFAFPGGVRVSLGVRFGVGIGVSLFVVVADLNILDTTGLPGAE